MVLTIDVITPIVDDPFAFGGIAAANAMSDVYAMGGRPEVALSFAGFPTDALPLSMLSDILRGMSEMAARAGCAIVGGHTVADTEPKCGLAVIGSVDPARVWSHRHAKPGDALILTKALGTGILGQAIKAGRATDAMTQEALAQMLMLNDRARDIGLEVGVIACTDITGFGLLGHLRNVIEAAGVSAVLHASQIPILSSARQFVEQGLVPGGTKRNLAYASAVTTFADAVDANLQLLLADAQTSGGLLLCVAQPRVAEAVTKLRDAGCVHASCIGVLEEATGGAGVVVTVRD